MCGRFVRHSSLHEIAQAFGAEEPSFDVQPDYNVAPSQDIVIITQERPRRIRLCRWGYVPSWARDPKTGYKMINARAESIADKPAFRSAFLSGRVLVPADGFYEWRKEGNTRIPFLVRLKSGRPFAFAGLCSGWKTLQGPAVCTCTIITTVANDRLKEIHDRMPVILRRKDEAVWMDRHHNDQDTLLGLLRPYDLDEMECCRVSSLVNSPGHNSPECLTPVDR
jgi:putative SOS response-associated peptidase YedK